MAETWLEARAGIEPACGPFLVRVLDAVSKTDKSDVEWHDSAWQGLRP